MSKEPPVLRGLQASQGLLDHKVTQASQELQARKVAQARRAIQVYKVQRVL